MDPQENMHKHQQLPWQKERSRRLSFSKCTYDVRVRPICMRTNARLLLVWMVWQIGRVKSSRPSRCRRNTKIQNTPGVRMKLKQKNMISNTILQVVSCNILGEFWKKIQRVYIYLNHDDTNWDYDHFLVFILCEHDIPWICLLCEKNVYPRGIHTFI